MKEKGEKNHDVNYYIRVNDQTQPANELIPQLLERKQKWPPYLDQTHPQAAFDAIDLMAYKEFLGRFELPQPVEEYLEPGIRFRGDILDLVTYPPGRTDQAVPRNFTILLFGREPHVFFRGAYAIFSVYMGKDRASNRSQRFELFGSIPALIRRLMTRLQIYMGMDIDTGEDMLTGNPNRRRFSESAVQEAIVNAFVHRDYRSHDPVRVTLFNDRLEVTSPGGPNTPFNAGQIREGRVHTSWRNPSLAWFMVELKFAQNEGKGIQIIMEQTKKIAGKEPGFFINSHWFSVEIPAFIPLLDSFQEKKEKVEVDFDVKNELRRLLKKFADKDSDFHKNIISSKKGMDTAEKLAESYNKFAQWLSGLPMVPGLFLQDK